ncbi:MAG: PDZ domain-containing protein [Methylophilales bacterium]|nr:PDZ domain-containing protein [Methylophilales bacterium]
MQHLKNGLLAFLLVGFTTHLALADEPKSDNPYTQNYKQRFAASKPTAEAPHVFRGTNRETDYQHLLEDGYDQMGTSGFQAGDVDPEQLGAQAQKVHADLALVYITSLGKQSMDAKIAAAKEKALKMAKPETERGDGEGLLMEFPELRYDYYATFWMKLPPPVLGLHVRDRKEDEDQPGVPVVAVIKGSPAAGSDIRKDDVVLKVAEVETNNGDTFVQTVRSNAGKTVEILLLRDDILVSKMVTLSAK